MLSWKKRKNRKVRTSSLTSVPPPPPGRPVRAKGDLRHRRAATVPKPTNQSTHTAVALRWHWHLRGLVRILCTGRWETLSCPDWGWKRPIPPLQGRKPCHATGMRNATWTGTLSNPLWKASMQPFLFSPSPSFLPPSPDPSSPVLYSLQVGPAPATATHNRPYRHAVWVSL